jgi:hypothetical protein
LRSTQPLADLERTLLTDSRAKLTGGRGTPRRRLLGKRHPDPRARVHPVRPKFSRRQADDPWRRSCRQRTEIDRSTSRWSHTLTSGGVTKNLELVTGVIILPQRQTALFAKQADDVDLFSEGRLRLGVGVGWNWVEFDSLEMSRHFRRRGKRQERRIASSPSSNTVAGTTNGLAILRRDAMLAGATYLS